MIECLQWLVKYFISEIVFSYSPPPSSSPTTTDPRHLRVDFESFFGRFRVDFESRQGIDSKTTRNRPKNDAKSTEKRRETTRKRLELDSWEAGSVVAGMSLGVDCSSKTISLYFRMTRFGID